MSYDKFPDRLSRPMSRGQAAPEHRRRTPRLLDPQPPLVGPRPIVGWALTTFWKTFWQIDLPWKNVLFCSPVNQG